MKKLTKYQDGHDLFRVIITIIILTLGRIVEMIFNQTGWIMGFLALLVAFIIALLLECAFEMYCKDRV